MTNLQIGHQLVQLPFDFCTMEAFAVIVALQFQHGADVLLDRQFAENRGFLWQIRQAVARAHMHRLAHEADVVNGNVAFVGADQAHHHVKTGGFARTVRAEQADHFAAAHVK